MNAPQASGSRVSIAQTPRKPRETASTTPGRLRVATGALCLGALLLWLAAYSGILDTRQTVQTIGKDAVPSIVAAQEIRANLADMDANAANAFFSSGTKAAKEQYDKDRQVVADRLVTAAQNITYGDEERVPIRQMVDGALVYTGLVDAARAKGYPDGLPDLYQASRLMHGQLLSAADALDKANYGHLDRAYAESRTTAGWVQVRLLATALLVLAVMLATQIFLASRTHRIFNIPLALATIVLVAFVAQLSLVLMAEKAHLKVAKQDAFDSINALWKARAVAYDANGDESLYLLDRRNHDPYEQSFRQKTALLADTPITDQVMADSADNRATFKGFLGDELRNITFPGEREAALEMLRTYARYMQIDGQIRSLETGGRHQEAVDLCTGTDEGQSNWAFARFDASLGKVLDINQKVFDATVAQAFAELTWLPYIAPTAAILIAWLSWLGLHRRIREYHA